MSLYEEKILKESNLWYRGTPSRFQPRASLIAEVFWTY